VALQIHGGCDVRGGYTKPRIFSLTDEYSIMRNADGCIQCTDNYNHEWSTDDAYNWYYQGSAGYHSGRQLDQYPIIDTDDLLFAVDADTDDLDEHLDNVIEDMLTEQTLAECIREYQTRYAVADLEQKNKYTDEDYQTALDILIYKRLIQRNQEYLETTLPLDMPGGKDKIEMLESEMIPYQCIIDRMKRRKAETKGKPQPRALLYFRDYTRRQTTLKIMEKQQAQRRRSIDDLKFQQQQYHEARSFIIAKDDKGFCPICQSKLDAY
jgi:hypothetical protein